MKNLRVTFFPDRFNTRMIQGSSLMLSRDQLDNPHKEKTWKCFRNQFQIEVVFL